MSAPAASSQAGSWSRQDSQAASTSSRPALPAPAARSLARPRRASWRSAASRSRTVRPVGVGLVGQQFPVLRQRRGELVIPELAGRQREPGPQRLVADLGIDDHVGRCPDVAQVGRQQRGAVLAELGQRAARHGQRLRQCAGGRARVQAREELLAREHPG